jgi:hypothetical protein
MTASTVGIISDRANLAQHLAVLLHQDALVGTPFIQLQPGDWPAVRDFLVAHDLRVCVYDLTPPYVLTWHNLTALKQALPDCRFVAVALDVRALERAVGPTPALPYGSALYWTEGRRIRAAVRAALRSVAEERAGAPAPVGRGSAP